MIRFFVFPIVALALTFSSSPAGDKKAPVLRAGIIGLDTSHVIAFTAILNKPDNIRDLAGVRVVAGFPGGSKDIPDSINRVQKYTDILRDKYGVKIVDSIEDLLKEVDVVLLESVDGRPHLAQVIPVLKSGKIVFIDKPIAGSLADVLRIFELSKKYKTPLFSSSALRFSPSVQSNRNDPKVGKILGCDVHAPCSLEPHHPDLFWYGIHGVETLFTIMGTGCQSVTRVHTKGTDVVTGLWQDGRIGTFRGNRAAKAGYGGMVFGDKGSAPAGTYEGYQHLVVEICKFFKTGQAPVSAAETIEIFAFMEAADESKRQGGMPVTLDSVLRKAQEENRKKYRD